MKYLLIATLLLTSSTSKAQFQLPTDSPYRNHVDTTIVRIQVMDTISKSISYMTLYRLSITKWSTERPARDADGSIPLHLIQHKEITYLGYLLLNKKTLPPYLFVISN